MKILAACSRHWPDSSYGTISFALIAAIEELTNKYPDDKTIKIVHGNCPARYHKGVYYAVDQYFTRFVKNNRKTMAGFGYNLDYIPYSADTKKYGSPKAFHIRNQQMVDDGADLGLFFVVRDKSPGTMGTWERAERAKIPTKIIYF